MVAPTTPLGPNSFQKKDPVLCTWSSVWHAAHSMLRSWSGVMHMCHAQRAVLIVLCAWVGGQARGDAMRWLHREEELEAGRKLLVQVMDAIEDLRPQLQSQGWVCGHVVSHV